MYYYSEAAMEVDDLIKEFIDFRDFKDFRSKNGQPEIQSQKSLDLIKEFLEFGSTSEQLDLFFTDSQKPKPIEPIRTDYEKIIFTTRGESTTDISAPVSMNAMTDNEQENLYQLYSETNKRFLPYVEQALDGFEFSGSPAYAERVEKETIAIIVDKAIELAAKNITEIIDIQKEMHRHPWTHARLLKACVESLTINELSFRRHILRGSSNVNTYQLL